MPDFPIPYHTDIMESFDGIDMDAAGRLSGSGFYYLLGDIAPSPPRLCWLMAGTS